MKSGSSKKYVKPKKPTLVPGWVWGGLITGAILIVLMAVNSVAFGLSSLTGGASLICYPIQLMVYLINGLISGSFEQKRYLNNKRLNPLTPKPNYLVVGALGGLIVTIIAAIVYVIVSTASVSLIPPAATLIGSTLPILIGIDAIAAIGLGAIGGFFYGRYFQ